MKIAFVGCGYVFDIYMRTHWAHSELDICGVFDLDTTRSATVSKHYGFKVYPDLATLLADPQVEAVVNLTSIHSHYATTKRALEAGKHVYSEKPFTTDIDKTRELFAMAETRGLVLSGAPSNLYCDAVSTLWKAVRDGAIGKPVLVYAELDDNPAHMMQLEKVQSPTGAPFPYAEEFQEGCTVEHVAYHLVWLCAMFGPVLSVTAFSDFLVHHKTDTPLIPADTPDFSVACLHFANGVAARVTCTWVSPRNHQMHIIGEQGEITADNVFHDQSPVHLERFSRVTLAARKAYTVRTQPLIGRLFGVGGRRQPLVRRWMSHAVEAEKGVGRSPKHKLVSWLRRREIYAQDKLLGIAEMSRALSEGRKQPMQPDFHMHINELSLLIQRAGRTGVALTPTTTFQPFEPLADVAQSQRNYLASYKSAPLERLVTGLVESLHKR
ncbi:Gfo/Idh/MocA family protein [Pseudorhodoferax soli]|uniref:Putative dehydrogenase n=1 Tax=Pseudorhodoferax soli TaxID=545864 RepID=A0A368Y8I3_9BURK|nr:Gfo/Idh/MocA family oxidoreductase [Pseudorhodoferax soli]RCW76029.1 putative dehydrogenase [Pseudorhodoferax soli]